MSDGWAATLMVDASHCPNTGAGGYGYWIASGRGKRGGSGPLGRVASSTLAEMQAIVNVLWHAREFKLVIPGDEVLIQTDCVSAIWKLEGRMELDDEENKCRDEYIKLNNLLYVELRHVKGHSGRTENRFRANANCDVEARAAMKQVRKFLLRGTHAFV